MAQDNRPVGTRSDWVMNLILRGLIGAIKVLPYAPRVRTMGALTRKVIAPLAGYRRRATENIALIYPEMPLRDVARLADRVADNVGRTLIETYSSEGLRKRAAASTVSGPGLQALERAKTKGQPVLLVTGHFGNHEAPRYALTQMGFEIGGLYRPMANVFFNAHYEKTMADVSGPVFAQGRKGTGQFVKFLRSGGAAVLLFDIYAKGAELPFMGQYAYTSLSAAELALKYNAVVIPFFGVRQPDGLSFDIQLDAPIAHSTPEAMLTQMNAALEKRITANPEQWFWFHNRWKANRRGKPAGR
ncbi:lysophospholipid acyltransferase family protein [Algirhabdus cladophorae]|uniref:lysophospholipid acyltransferase family protein n=1 Tax=Algirhabdus cladophorae TaxID=3377108 RepID=UPI003B84A0D2